MSEVHTTIAVKVNPTEDPEKVKKAVQNIFPTSSFERIPQKKELLLMAKIDGKTGLSKFYNLLRQERILDAARAVLLNGIDENKITFYLNKQVAYVEHISFCEPLGESPLGPIRVEITCDGTRVLVDWLSLRSV